MFFLLVISEDGRAIICGIYDKHYKRMLYTATQMLGINRGEEAVHDVFMKLIEKFGENTESLGDKPGQYFVVLVRNHSIDLLRKERITLELFDDEDENSDIFKDNIIDPEETLIENEAADRLVSLIRRLKPAARQILEYKYIAEYSNKEIADIMGISQTAVSTRIDKAKKRLREILESEEALDNAK